MKPSTPCTPSPMAAALTCSNPVFNRFLSDKSLKEVNIVSICGVREKRHEFSVRHEQAAAFIGRGLCFDCILKFNSAPKRFAERACMSACCPFCHQWFLFPIREYDAVMLRDRQGLCVSCHACSLQHRMPSGGKKRKMRIMFEDDEEDYRDLVKAVGMPEKQMAEEAAARAAQAAALAAAAAVAKAQDNAVEESQGSEGDIQCWRTNSDD